MAQARSTGARLRNRCVAICALLACAGAPGLARAADDWALPAVSLRGFGTLGAVHSDERNADFVSGFFEPNGAGRTHRWAFGIDSKLGLQADAKISESLSATVQLVARHGHDNAYTPQIEWANLKYQLTPDFAVRFGRTVAMPFMVSDSRLVGYGNPWIRPPQEVYGLDPHHEQGRRRRDLAAPHGRHDERHTRVVREDFRQASGFGQGQGPPLFRRLEHVEYGPASLRASYSSGRVDLTTTDLDALVAGLTQFGNAASALPPFAAAGARALGLARTYRFENAPISLVALGAAYDRERWLFMAEWAKFNGHSLLADSTAWYATARLPDPRIHALRDGCPAAAGAAVGKRHLHGRAAAAALDDRRRAQHRSWRGHRRGDVRRSAASQPACAGTS